MKRYASLFRDSDAVFDLDKLTAFQAQVSQGDIYIMNFWQCRPLIQLWVKGDASGEWQSFNVPGWFLVGLASKNHWRPNSQTVGLKLSFQLSILTNILHWNGLGWRWWKMMQKGDPMASTDSNSVWGSTAKVGSTSWRSMVVGCQWKLRPFLKDGGGLCLVRPFCRFFSRWARNGGAYQDGVVHLGEHGPQVLLANELPGDAAGAGVVPYDRGHSEQMPEVPRQRCKMWGWVCCKTPCNFDKKAKQCQTCFIFS